MKELMRTKRLVRTMKCEKVPDELAPPPTHTHKAGNCNQICTSKIFLYENNLNDVKYAIA